MIQSEVHRIQSHCSVGKQDSSGGDQQLRYELKNSTFEVFSSLEIAQSNYLSDSYDKVKQSSSRSISSDGITCPSCQYWEAWAQKSQEKLLLIEKKLIERQKGLQQKMKILHDELRNQNEVWKIKQNKYLEEIFQDKQTIKKLYLRTNELELFLRKGGCTQKHKKFDRNQNSEETSWKQNQRQKMRLYNDMNEIILKKEKHQNINSLVSQTSQFIQSSDNGTNRKFGTEDKYILLKRQIALKQLDSYRNENQNCENHDEQDEKLNAKLRIGFLRKNYQNQQSIQNQNSAQKNLQKKEKRKQCENQPSKTSLDPLGSRNTIKTLKLHNHKVSVQKSIFNKATTECSFVNISQNENENDKNWYSGGNPEIGHNQYFDEAKHRENGYLMSQEIKKLKFENQNLKSYNRVLLQKLSNSRPRKY